MVDVNDDELAESMGAYLKTAARIPVNEQFKPVPAQMPKPGEKAAAEAKPKGIPPPFPIVPNNEIHKYPQVKQTDTDTFGHQQTGKFDPELNELALKEVAASKGMSVEQLLESRADRKSEVKLDAAKPVEEKPTGEPVEQVQVKPPSSFFSPEDEEIAAMEAKLAEARTRKAASGAVPEKETLTAEQLQAKMLATEKRRQKKKDDRKRETEKTGVPKEFHDNPVIEKLRKKLSMDSIEPAKVSIEGIKFELLPPPAALNLWILEKIQAGREVVGDGTPLAMTIKIATIAASISKIEGEEIRDVLGVPHSDASDELGVKLLCAQTLWEMLIGLPSRKDLFQFDPELAMKLYEPFKAKFGTRDLKTSFQEDIHRFVCPVGDCMEMYDMVPMASELPPFCKVHGVITEDKGLVRELRSVPLV